MAGSRISKTVRHTVTIGSQHYPSPLTITPTGDVAPTKYRTPGVVAGPGLTNLALLNHGTITAANGADGQNFNAASGGIGVILLSTAIVENTGHITGGAGGYSKAYNGGLGGIGLYQVDGQLANKGFIIGGAGGNGPNAMGGAGDSGAVFGGDGILANSGVIIGGAGGASNYTAGGAGGTGVALLGAGTLVNTGTILGGFGGAGDYSPPTSGGIGAMFEGGGVLQNTGLIAGGNGSLDISDGDNGGIGFAIDGGGTLSNAGTISGGTGARGYRVGGNGGDGMSLGGDGTLTNSGIIRGGAGGSAFSYAGAGGIGVDVRANCAVTNTGTILGGAGGSSADGAPGGIGVYLNGGTLVTSGTISGGAGGGKYPQADALEFGTLAGTLVVDPGALFSGNVAATQGAGDVLTLAGTRAGTLAGLGTAFTGFATVTETKAAQWTLTQTNALGAETNLLDFGTMDVAGTLTDAGDATVTGKAILQPVGTGTILLASLTLSGGTLSAASQAILAIGTTLTGDNADQITIDAGAALTGHGKFLAPLVDNGSILAQGGTLKLSESASGTGVLTIGSGGAVSANASLNIASIAFASGGNEFLLARPTELSSTISGFGGGDIIDIRPLTATTLSFLAGTLTLFDGAKMVDELYLSGNYEDANFALSPDHHGGTDIRFVTDTDTFTTSHVAGNSGEIATLTWGFHTAEPFAAAPLLSWLPHAT